MSQLYRRIKSHLLGMPFASFIGSLFAVVVAVVLAMRYENTVTSARLQCRSFPGDPSWPSDDIWADLNNTVHGRLIAAAPIAAPCHTSVFGQPNALFNEDVCATLRDNWFFPETHLPSPSSPMAYAFSNNSCNPFLDDSTPCTIGSHPVYVVNATSSGDFQAAIRFARDHNIRLVVRNTGHDYLGKSTGAHSLTLWTHHMKSIQLLKYQSTQYTGPAIKVGAGVEGMEAYKFAASHDLVVVGGNCPTVGFVGGFTQGGGHGPLASKYGLSADQVLEWEVVTSSGEVVTASATQNNDLFWALRGGGGGTFGVVSSLTVKAFPDAQTSLATMAILNDAAPFGFMISPAIAPGLAAAKLDDLIQPFITRLNNLGLEHQYYFTGYPTFIESYEALQLISSWNVSDYNVGSRLIPRDLATQNPEALVEAIRYISSKTIMSGVSYNLKSSGLAPGDVAVNPYLRQALFSATVGTPIDYANWTATKLAQDMITNDLLPSLEKLTPGGAAYLNEADFQQPNFQRTIYGDHYEKLQSIKRKYDPEGIFYAVTAVGSEDWVETEDGRLFALLDARMGFQEVSEYFGMPKVGLIPTQFHTYCDAVHVPLLKTPVGSTFPLSHTHHFITRYKEQPQTSDPSPLDDESRPHESPSDATPSANHNAAATESYNNDYNPSADVMAEEMHADAGASLGQQKQRRGGGDAEEDGDDNSSAAHYPAVMYRGQSSDVQYGAITMIVREDKACFERFRAVFTSDKVARRMVTDEAAFLDHGLRLVVALTKSAVTYRAGQSRAATILHPLSETANI
ncbi:hypothetical protein EKO27_g2078 [Xylaria grammica]|uniref:FAD-binding PCMH-type domain-containing protein n=1 Tax=Xylaria grammica TaxID=363999 RepID=A0A439DF43_9PEZI|nr:hypothetical protein EKO27_g2078 [Xylaria grammica]